MYKKILFSRSNRKMKLLCLALILVWARKVTPLHCRCSGAYCDDVTLDNCYTIHSCFNHTIGGNVTYGCTEKIGWQKLFCNMPPGIFTLKCCTSEFCNSNGLPSKPYLPVPSLKIASLVKGKVTGYINDTSANRAKIDGYVVTAYTPGRTGRRLRLLRSNARLFTFDHLSVNTTYVIDVTSYRGSLTSNRSQPLIIKTESVECDYYRNGKVGGKRSCSAFGCFSLWRKNGTKLEIQERGCWNNVSVSKCMDFNISSNSTFVFCTCHNGHCTPARKKLKNQVETF